MLGNYCTFLIAQNYKMEELRRMSLRQIEALCNVFIQKEKKDLLELASIMRMSQADGKDWKKFIAELTK